MPELFSFKHSGQIFRDFPLEGKNPKVFPISMVVKTTCNFLKDIAFDQNESEK
jgi:hypothetical protein